MKYIKKLKPRTFTVRCLGPGAEHTFLSNDPAKNRLCEKCRQLIKNVHPEPVFTVDLNQ